MVVRPSTRAKQPIQSSDGQRPQIARPIFVFPQHHDHEPSSSATSVDLSTTTPTTSFHPDPHHRTTSSSPHLHPTQADPDLQPWPTENPFQHDPSAI
ncbi:hypothetical protein ACLOJK_000106 [Asimina triloba]